MPASQEQKVDFLLKKIGYSASKTGIAEDESTISGSPTNTRKFPFEEGIPSPLIIPSTSLWSDSSLIPTTPPGSDTAYVKVYPTSSALRMTADSTIGTNKRTYIAYTTYNDTSSARLTNWIDTQFGSSYIIKVFKNDATVPANELSQVGGNNQTDGWFFDYSSGILNFNGVNIPSHTDIYLVGYRYIGGTGAQPPAGIGTFLDLIVERHLSVGGISTFTGSIDANSNLDVAGISTFNNLIDANGRIVGIQTNSVIPFYYDNVSDFPSAATYHGAFAHAHNTGKAYFAHAGWKEIVSKEASGVVGTGTETYHIGNLNVTGITTLGNIGISTGRITGPAITYIDPATVGTAGTVVILGDLQVDGTQTTVNSSTMTVTDKNIELAKGAANDAAANGGGITVKSGGGDKTWQWLDATDSWTSSEHIRIPDDKVFGFASDTNTFISRPSPDQIAFTNGGTESMRIFGYGQVQIADGVDRRSGKAELTISGISSVVLADNNPLYNQQNPCFLHLSNANNSIDASETGILFHNTFSGSGNVALYAKKTSDFNNDLIFRFRTGASTSAERVRIKSTGQVGIGTDNPSHKLDVLGDTELQGNLNVGGATTITALNNAMPFSIVTSKSSGGIGTYLFKNSSGRFDFKFENTYNGNWHTGSTFHTRILWAAPNESGTTPEVCSIMPNTASAGAGGALHSLEFNVTDNTSGLKKAYRMQHNRHQFYLNDNIVGLEINSTQGIGVTSYIFHGYTGGIGDTDTRFGFSQNENIVFDTNGTQRFRIQNNSSTFSNNLFVSANLDVDGHTELDDVNVSGISTFGGAIDANSTSNFGDDVTFETTNGNNLLFDKDDNSLKFGDSVRAKFGASTDLEIYHTTASGGTNFIKGTGNLTLQGNVIVLEDQSGNDYIRIDNGGAVKIHHPGSTEKIRTTSTGVQVTGLTDTDTLTTGNATFTGSVSAGSTTGTDGYYLKSVGTGVTWAAFPSSRTGLTTSATAGQTSFNFSYNVGFVDVFLNGVKLPASEFTASNGSTIVLDDAAFANDTLEFISLNTLPVTSGGASNLDGLADVTITSPKYGQTLRYNGVKFVNDFHPHATTTSTSQVSITNLPIASYRSAEYLIQVTEGTKYHVTKIIAIHDGTNVTFNEYGTITTSTPLATFSVDINSGIMRLLATPASTNSTSFKVKFDAIAV